MLYNYPFDIFTEFEDAGKVVLIVLKLINIKIGINPNVFTKNTIPAELINYFLDPIKPILINNVYNSFQTKEEKYSQYVNKPKEITKEIITHQVERYLIATIKIRSHKKKSADRKDWWNEEHGDVFIQQCISRNWYQAITGAMFDFPTNTENIASAEEILSLIKTKMQSCFKLPRFTTVDECMTKVRIHHLVSFKK